MDEHFAAIISPRGFAFRAELLAGGLTDRDLRQGLRAGRLSRLRHGTYALKADVERMTPTQRHRLKARSVLERLGDDYVLSHHSAAMFFTDAAFDIDLGVVHVTRVDGRTSGREAGVQFHDNGVAADDVEQVEPGVRVTRAPRAAFESATISSAESGLVVVNGVLSSGACRLVEIKEYAERQLRWPGSRVARLVARLADPGCESVGESRSMFMFWREGLPRPETQAEIVSADGTVVARSDFRWRGCAHVGEFDGLVKYGLLNDGSDPTAVLVSEKRREDQIRACGYGVSRWTWADLAPGRRSATAARIRQDLERSRRFVLAPGA